VILRPDQVEIIDETRATFAAGHRVVVLQAPTGFGKTACASYMLGEAEKRGPALFLAHLDALIVDTAERLRNSGLRVGVIQADETPDPEARVQVCSIQTLVRRGIRPSARFLILDEGHRVMGPTVRQLLDGYPEARILLLTATPQRGDGQPLGDIATALISGPKPRELISAGRLVPPIVIGPPTVEEEGVITSPVDAFLRQSPEGTAIVFCANVAHAKETAREFEAASIPAATIVGETPRRQRREIREKLSSGELRALVGVAVFLEGFDAPEIDTVILARSFGVTGSFLQAIGRGLRPAPGKSRCLVLDLRGSVHLHGLPDEDRVWTLEGTASRRAEKLSALRRCSDCGAIFRPSSRCPLCQAEAKSAAKIPRNLNRAERLQLLSGIPQAELDRRYLAKLEWVAVARRRLPDWKARSWALAQFEKTRGRKPEVAA
jgi:DNA repair protein RadD